MAVRTQHLGRETPSYEDLNHKRLYTLHMRNTETEERRNVTTYARDETAAAGVAFVALDTESGDRSWCLDAFTVDNTVYGEVR